MRPIKNQNLAQLLIQLRFAPQKHRQKQLDAAEKLLGIIESDKEYPFDFVCFRITGYHPKALPEPVIIKGDELAEDLRIFVSKLSGRLARPAAEQAEKLYTIEELADKIGVSTKTIHRWRKRGLIARKYVFADGRKRFGFLQSAVDEFFHKNPQLVTRARDFGRLGAKEKQQIIQQARNLAARTQLSRHQIMAQIAEKTGRAHETIRYTIMNYEAETPQKSVFKKPSGVIDPHEAAELHKLYKQGATVQELMARFHRSRSSVYRLINLQRAKEILARKVEFIASEEFFAENAGREILGRSLNLSTEPAGRSIKEFELAADSLLPEYLQALNDAPSLDRQAERELFRRYNYLKYLACISRTGLTLSNVSSARLKQIENYLAEAEAIKKTIIEANLRLVISVAMKHMTAGTNLSDLVSEGNFSLMQAVERFDYTRGVRFASLASWAIAKDYAHKAPGETGRARKPRTAALREFHLDLRTRTGADVLAVERARQSLTDVIRDNLDQREQHIILNHFGLLGSPVKKTKKTLAQIGDELGITKERVRQIELVALQKLRHSLSPEQFELLTG